MITICKKSGSIVCHQQYLLNAGWIAVPPLWCSLNGCLLSFDVIFLSVTWGCPSASAGVWSVWCEARRCYWIWRICPLSQCLSSQCTHGRQNQLSAFVLLSLSLCLSHFTVHRNTYLEGCHVNSWDGYLGGGGPNSRKDGCEVWWHLSQS